MIKSVSVTRLQKGAFLEAYRVKQFNLEAYRAKQFYLEAVFFRKIVKSDAETKTTLTHFFNSLDSSQN